MVDSLKQKTISGMIWNVVERFGSASFLFVSNLVLARLLSPNDFGCIGMLMVFISISDAIIDGGFGSALIQKKNPTQVDYSTIFYWNLFLSIFLYLTLFLTSPAIANFYNVPLFSDVLKVQGLILIINALILIQQNILKKQIALKKIAQINLVAIIIGTGTGILFAFLGFGVWSLVIKSLTTGLIQCVIYWINTHWRPRWVFSWTSFTRLFKFGSFIFLNDITSNLYYNLIVLIIGKKESAFALGLFTQARKLEEIPRRCFSGAVANVAFIALADIQDDLTRIRRASSKCVKALAFINFTFMMLLIIVAKPLFILLLSEKWIQAVSYFQILCLSGLIVSLLELNNSIIKSLGKSRCAFHLNLAQSIIGVFLIIIGANWGVKGILLGWTLSQYAGYAMVSVQVGKLIKYGLIHQIKDFLPIFFVSIIASIMAYSVSFLGEIQYILLLLLQIVVFSLSVLLFSILFRIKEMNVYLSVIKTKINKYKSGRTCFFTRNRYDN